MAVSVALGAGEIPGWTPAEESLAKRAAAVPDKAVLASFRKRIKAGDDPLGEALCELRSPEVRRPDGATYTPEPIVQSMVAWASENIKPARVVDPGSGSGRFAVAAGRQFKRASLIGVELDPVAAILSRGHLASAGMKNRAQVVCQDYRQFDFSGFQGKTLFLGNPPYVRHHLLGTPWKEWLTREAGLLGFSASQLAGLHVYFFLQTALKASPDDLGVFITAAEWLDVNYGSLVRNLFLEQLGGEALHVIAPTAKPFDDADTTAVVSCFRVGSKPQSIRMKRVAEISELEGLRGGVPVLRERLVEARRWTALTRPPKKMPEGFVELGEVCRVHRGAVTGRNATWVVNPDEALPEEFKVASVTRARELFAAEFVLDNDDHLRRVVDIPADLDELNDDDRKAVDKFLKKAKKAGAHSGYVARHRKSWWSVGLKAPAPILATYMARRPPAFVRNETEARHINIAHGLYPREPMTKEALDALATSLREVATLGDGRTYSGGLTKFEPREMERLPVPNPELLLAK